MKLPLLHFYNPPKAQNRNIIQPQNHNRHHKKDAK